MMEELQLPPGFRFLPTNEELVDYLINKVSGNPLPNVPIHTLDIYQDDPESITGRYQSGNEEEWFFFTTLEKKHQNGIRLSRLVKGNCYWKTTTAPDPVQNNDRIIGNKRVLDYYDSRGQRTHWKMYEYTLEHMHPRLHGLARELLETWAICKIYKTSRKSSKVDRPVEATERVVDQTTLVMSQVGRRQYQLQEPNIEQSTVPPTQVEQQEAATYGQISRLEDQLAFNVSSLESKYNYDFNFDIEFGTYDWVFQGTMPNP